MDEQTHKRSAAYWKAYEKVLTDMCIYLKPCYYVKQRTHSSTRSGFTLHFSLYRNGFKVGQVQVNF